MQTLSIPSILLFLFCNIFLIVGCKDECKDLVCLNGGVCENGECNCPENYSGVNCGILNCPDGYSGEDCQNLDREKFIGEYEGTETRTDENGNENTYDTYVTITSGGEIDEINIEQTTDGSIQITTLNFIANADEDQFAIQQALTEGEIGDIEFELTNEGSGNLNGNELIMNTSTNGFLTYDDGTDEDLSFTSVTSVTKQ